MRKIILFTTLLLAQSGLAELTPLLPNDKSRPHRAKVLLLGDTVSVATARVVQERMCDTVTLFIETSPLRTARDISDFLRTSASEEYRREKWDAVCIATIDEVSKVPTEVAASFGVKLPVVVVDLPMSMDVEHLTNKLTQALLQSSAPWAELPPGENRDPGKLLADDALLANPESLPVLPRHTATVFHAEEGQWQFNLHSFIAHYAGRFWAIWSSGRVDEDSSSQIIRYSTSVDGSNWSLPKVVVGDPDGEFGPLRWLAAGLYSENGNLYALGCLNEGDRDGKIWDAARLVRLQWTKDGWKDESIFAKSCMVYFPPIRVQGRDFFVWRNEFAHFFTARSTPQIGQWEVKKHPSFPPDYRLSETACFVDTEDTLHLIIRDQGKTKRLYHSLSFDHGSTWTLPQKTNYPDAVSKNFAGRLHDGTYYLINNPKTNGLRDPLTISFSRDGWTFSNPKILRNEAPARRHQGKAKSDHSFQYADAMEHDGYLYVIYSVNKEDIEISRYDFAELLRP